MPLHALDLPHGAALYDATRIDPSTVQKLAVGDPAWRGTPLAGATGRQGVHLIGHPGGRWISRRNHRGGLVGRLIKKRYVWLGAERTRVFREARLLDHLRTAGLPVPPVIAAFYRRAGLTYRGTLVTAYLPETKTLAHHLATSDLRPELWRAVGDCLARFYHLGVFHADLNAHNILIDATEKVWVIDFDRGRLRPPGPWIQRTLARLERSILKITPTGSQSKILDLARDLLRETVPIGSLLVFLFLSVEATDILHFRA